MKLSVAAVLWGFLAFLVFPGCSEEENFPPPRQKQKVVRPAPVPEIEKKKPILIVEEKRKNPEEEEIATKEPAPERKPPETQEEPKGKEEGPHYVVRDRVSLSTIAGREEVYQDPLKWVMLVRFNLEELSQLPETPHFAEEKLPEGTTLRIVMPRQSAVEEKKADHLWVVNVMSARTNEEIVPLAVRLVRRGFPVYVTRTQVKGKEWMRLRVGFFAAKAEAQEVGKKIKETVRVEEPWIVKAGKEEHAEFAGFLERESGS